MCAAVVKIPLQPNTIFESTFSAVHVRAATRKPWIATIALFQLVWLLSFNSEGLALQLTVGAVGSALFVFVLLRYGLLALAAEILVENVLFYYPPVLRPNTWLLHHHTGSLAGGNGDGGVRFVAPWRADRCFRGLLEEA